MKTLRYSLISCLTFIIFSSVSYIACKKDKCKNTTCTNGGSCLNGVCTCPTQYSGKNCETDLCAGVTCQNGGMCVHGKCNCVNGYEGNRCQVLNKYIGNYSAVDTCNGGGSTKVYTVTITMPPNGQPAVIKIGGLAPNQSNIYATISSGGNSFNFNTTTYEGYYFMGTGIFNNNGTISIGYTVDYGSSSYSCVGAWMKL